MHHHYCLLFIGFSLSSLAQAQGNNPITGNVLVRNAYQNNSLLAETSIELQPGFSVDAPGFSAAIGRSYAQGGQWQGVYNWPIVGIHTHVLPNGKVLTWQGHNDNSHGHTGIYDWAPATTALTLLQTVHDNIFCSGHTLLPDGRLFVAGGHDRYYDAQPPLQIGDPPIPAYIGGLKITYTYNHSTNSWQQQADMKRNRWYPTTTVLGDGSVLSVSGETEPYTILSNPDRSEQNRYRPELWQNGGWSWLDNADRERRLPLYPMMFLAPDGRVFNAGPNKLTGYIDVANGGTWTDGPEHQLGGAVPATAQAGRYFDGAHHEGTAVMYEPGKILVIGGHGAGGVTNTVERINLNDATPQFQYDAPMAYPRVHVNSTVLPDGSVLVTGGIPNLDKRDADAVLPVELWTPPASGSGNGTWTTLNPMGEPRLYHSTAVLLPDGRVLSAGGGHGGGYTDHPTAEVFSPPYLFKGPRPEISYTPGMVSYGQPFAFNTPNPAHIDAVTWIRLSSVTHSFNMNQRFLRLPITARTGTSVTVAAPTNPNDCPPGHYMVFALRNGVPSEAKIVSISNSPCAAAISMATNISRYSCGATATANVSGTNLGSSYRWYINGIHQPAFDGQPSASASLTNCDSQTSFTVEVIPTCGGAPLTASQTVSTSIFSQGGTACLCE